MRWIFVLASAAFVLGACAHRAQPVYEVDKPLPAQSLSLDQIESSIIEAGTALKWEFQKVGEGHLKAMQQQPQFRAVVDIYFDQQKYKIVKNSTTGLRDTGSTIHSHYNVWVRNLEQAIDRKLGPAPTRS